MRDFLTKFFAVCGVLTMFGLLQACFSDSNADSDSSSVMSKAEVEALIDAAVSPLEQRIAELESTQPGDRVVAGSASNGTATLKMTADGTLETSGQDLGTLLGYIPANVPVYESTMFSVRSPKGYLYAVPSGPSASGQTAINQEPYVFFESTDCTGQAYAGPFVSRYGAEQGTVFRIGAGSMNEIIDNPQQYFYVPAGSPQLLITAVSRMDTLGNCIYPNEFHIPYGFAALPNDPEITGVQSAPIPTPIQLQ